MPWVAGLLAIVALVLPLLGAPAAAQDTDAKVLRVHQPFYPDVLDPHRISYVEEFAVTDLEFEALTRLDTELNTVPAAAESWAFDEDGTAITFTLREGLAFSDGSPLTADHFVYAIQRSCDPATAAPYAVLAFDIVGCEEFYTSAAGATPAAGEAPTAEGVGVRALDDRTLEFRLRQPAPYFPTIASMHLFYPLKPELAEQGGEAWWQDPGLRVGNGPFRLTRIEPDQLIAFEANEHYWEGRPRLDGVEYVYIDDHAVALEAYRADQLDIMVLDPSQLPAVETDPALNPELLRYPTASTIGLMFDHKQEPVSDPKVREALAYGLDRQTYCDDIMHGACLPTQSWIPEGVPGHVATDAYAYDPEKAKQALAESSYGGPEDLPEITFFYLTDDPAFRERAEWIAGQYRDLLGIALALEPVDSTTFASLTKDAATFPEMSELGWIMDYPDPQNWLSIYWTCDSTIYAGLAGYCNEEFDALVGQADAELDPAARMALYEEAQRLLLADAPAVFAYNLANNVLVKPRVTGFVPTPAEALWPGQRSSKLTLDIEPAAPAATPAS